MGGRETISILRPSTFSTQSLPRPWVPCIEPQVRKARDLRARRLQQQPQSVSVGDLGTVDLGFEHQSLRIHQERRFLPRTFFPPSYPRASPPTPVVLADCDRLPLRWAVGSPQLHPQAFTQSCVEPIKGSIYAPPPEPPVDGLPRREVAGQKPPSAAAREDVEDGVEDLAGAVGFRSSSLVGRRNIEFQTLPFGVGEVGCVAPFHAQERTSPTYPSRFSKQFH